MTEPGRIKVLGLLQRLPVELDGGRQRVEPFEDGNVHGLSLHVIPADAGGWIQMTTA